MKKGAKEQKLEAVAEEEEEASKMSIDIRKQKKPSSRKSSKDNKEEAEKPEKAKKDKKPKTKEAEKQTEEKDKKEEKVEKVGNLPEPSKDTISSVYNDLDQLSNHLARTFNSFEAQKAAPSYQPRFFNESQEQRPYAQNRMPQNYLGAGSQDFNMPKSSNYYPDDRSHQRRYEEGEKEWYNMGEKELLQRYVFKEDDIRGETPFYDQSRGHVHKPRLHESHQKSLSTQLMSSSNKDITRKGEMFQRSTLKDATDLCQTADKYYGALQTKLKQTPQEGRDIRELYRHQPRHFFVEQDMVSNNAPGQKIPGRSPQRTIPMESRSNPNLKNSGIVYVNRFFG